ncbi:MAG: hypothetical protein II229_00235, partial [Clostridia bacterium]|nr:hypothetical protein [Clostridia bacterium]
MSSIMEYAFFIERATLAGKAVLYPAPPVGASCAIAYNVRLFTPNAIAIPATVGFTSLEDIIVKYS